MTPNNNKDLSLCNVPGPGPDLVPGSGLSLINDDVMMEYNGRHMSSMIFCIDHYCYRGALCNALKPIVSVYYVD